MVSSPPASALASLSLSSSQSNNEEEEIPSSRNQLRYFQAKRNRWNASQQLRQRPLASPPPPALLPPPSGSATVSSSSSSTQLVGSNRVSSNADIVPPKGGIGKQQHRGGGLALSATDNNSINRDGRGVGVGSLRLSSSPPTDRQFKQLTVTAKISGNYDDNNNSRKDNSSSDIVSHKDQVVRFYAQYNPDKLDGVDALLKKYQGREEELLQKLKDKYEGGASIASSLTTSKYPLPPPTGTSLTRCYFRFSSHPTQRVVIELFDQLVPVTSENFRTLCLRPPSMGYKQSIVHRIVPNFCVQMGDYTAGNGTGGRSIYSQTGNDCASRHGIKVDMWGNFADEAFVQHSEAGLVSMANNGPNKNSSQFFVTLKPLAHLDGKHVVFGRVVEGYQEVIANLAQTTVTDDKQRPLVETIRIVDCGQLVDGVEVRHQEEKEPATVTSATATNPSVAGFSFGSAAAAATSAAPFGSAFGFGSSTAAPSSSSSTIKLPSTFGAAFGFGGSTAAAGATTATTTPAPFSFAALSAAVTNTSCDAFSSLRAVAQGEEREGDHFETTRRAEAAAIDGTSFRLGTLDENNSLSPVSTNVDGWHPVSTFSLQPRTGAVPKTSNEPDAAAATALRYTPSVPFSFSPSSTLTTVDPLSFASSSFTVDDRSPTSSRDVEASSGLPTRHRDSEVDNDDDNDEDDEEYDPDDDEEEYDSDETPSSCSEESVDDVDDVVTEADSFRIQDPTESTFSGAVPAPQVQDTPRGFAAARGPGPTFGGVSALGSTGFLSSTSTSNVDESSALGAVGVNQSSTKTSGSATATTNANETAKSTPFSHLSGFGFVSTLPGIGSGNGTSLSFASLAASVTVTPALFRATTAGSDGNHFSDKVNSPQPTPTPGGRSSTGLSFTAFRLASSQTDTAARVGDSAEDDSDDGDHETKSSTSSSSRSESPIGDRLSQEEDEPAVAALTNTGCLSAAPTTQYVNGVPRGSREAIEATQPSSTANETETNEIPTTCVLSGLDSNDDLTSPPDIVPTVSGEAQDPTQDGDAACEPPNAYSISFSSYGSVTFPDPAPSHDDAPSNCNSPASRAQMQSLLDCSSETIDVPTDKLNETCVSVIDDEAPEVSKADPNGATCGMCWCLKSDTIETANPSIADESDEVNQQFHNVDAVAAETPKGDHVEPFEDQENLQVGSTPAKDAIPSVLVHDPKPAASPRSPVLPDPTMSTDSEKDYVPESLRRFVAEASHALKEGHKSFLTCVKEDRPLPDDVVPQAKVLERPPSAAAPGGGEKAGTSVPPADLTAPEEDVRVATTNSASNSMLYLKPLLFVLDAPNAQTRPLVTPTYRFQVLGDNNLPKNSAKKRSKPVSAPYHMPFLPPSSMPSPHDASLDLTYTAIFVRYRTAAESREDSPMGPAATGGKAGAVDDEPKLPNGSNEDVSSAPSSQPYYFGNSGPSSSAFYFGNSATLSVSAPTHLPAVPSSGSWYTAGVSSTSPIQSAASAKSPGLVGATFSSSSASLSPTLGVVSGGMSGGTADVRGAAGTIPAPSSDVFVFGSDILPVVFNFDDDNARQATYARYGVGGGAGATGGDGEGMVDPVPHGRARRSG